MVLLTLTKCSSPYLFRQKEDQRYYQDIQSTRLYEKESLYIKHLGLI